VILAVEKVFFAAVDLKVTQMNESREIQFNCDKDYRARVSRARERSLPRKQHENRHRHLTHTQVVVGNTPGQDDIFWGEIVIDRSV
jgi:hypothetical protein